MNSISPQMLALAGRDVSLFSGPTGEAAAAAPPLRRMVRFASRWRWLLLSGVAAGAVAGAAVTAVMTPQYASTSRLEIARDTARVVNIDSVQRDTGLGDQEFYQTEYGLLRTQVLAERVARDLGVVDDPGFFRLFGRKLKGAAVGPGGHSKRNEIAGRLLLLHVAVAPVRGSRLVDIRALTPDPGLSQRIAETWSRDFIASNLERRFEASSYARHFLEERLAQLREKLEASEREAVSYASQQGIINLPSAGDQAAGGPSAGAAGGRSLVTDDLTALNGALATATAERILAQSRLREAAQPGASAEALGNEAINVLRQKRADAAAEYARLMVQFEPGYPQAKAAASQVQSLDAAIAREEGRVGTTLQQTYAAAVAREQALSAKVNGLKGSLTDLRQRSIQYNIYQRDADTNRELYDSLLQRYKEIGVAGGIENNNVSVVDAAKLAERPSSPRLLLNLILAILAGGLSGLALAAVLQQIDEGVSDPAEVEEKLGLTLLGVAPRVRGGEPLKALKDPRSKLVEAYLAVQANLELSTAHGAPRSMAVMSTRPREGKSTTTVALAQSLARARRRVVLVDADLRAPSVHSAFGLPNATGVSNFLAGAEDLDAMLHKTDRDGLSVITAGPQPPNAADLLMGDRLSQLIKALQERFDHVIVDAPPVMGLADGPLVASAVDSVLYVVEARAVPAGMVRAAVARLKSAHVHMLGAILTKLDGKSVRSVYGYGYGYGYGNSRGG